MRVLSNGLDQTTPQPLPLMLGVYVELTKVHRTVAAPAQGECNRFVVGSRQHPQQPITMCSRKLRLRQTVQVVGQPGLSVQTARRILDGRELGKLRWLCRPKLVVLHDRSEASVCKAWQRGPLSATQRPSNSAGERGFQSGRRTEGASSARVLCYDSRMREWALIVVGSTACVPNPLFSPGNDGTTEALTSGSDQTSGAPSTSPVPDDATGESGTTAGSVDTGATHGGSDTNTATTLPDDDDGSDGTTEPNAKTPCGDEVNADSLEACWNFEQLVDRGQGLVALDAVDQFPMVFTTPPGIVAPSFWGQGLDTDLLDTDAAGLPDASSGDGYQPLTLELWVSSPPNDWSANAIQVMVSGTSGSVATIRFANIVGDPTIFFLAFDTGASATLKTDDLVACIAVTMDATGSSTGYIRTTDDELRTIESATATAVDVGGVRQIELHSETEGFIDGLRWWSRALPAKAVCKPAPPPS